MCKEVANFLNNYRKGKGNELYTPPASSKCSVVAWLAGYANVDRSLLKTYSNINDIIQALIEGKKIVLPGPDPNLARLERQLSQGNDLQRHPPMKPNWLVL